MRKRILSLLLVICLCMSMVPATFAAGTHENGTDVTQIEWLKSDGTTQQRGLTYNNAAKTYDGGKTNTTGVLYTTADALALPLEEGAEWSLNIDLASYVNGQIVAFNPTDIYSRIYLGSNEGRSDVRLGFTFDYTDVSNSTGAKYYNFTWKGISEKIWDGNAHTLQLNYSGGKFTLIVDNTSTYTINSIVVGNDAEIDVDDTDGRISQVVVDLIKSQTGSEYLILNGGGNENVKLGFSGAFNSVSATIKGTGYENDPIPVVSDKNVHFLGSSIFNGYGSETKKVTTFVDALARKWNVDTFQKQAVNGTTLAVRDGVTTSYCERYESFTDKDECDALVIQLSTNDFNVDNSTNTPVGTVTEGAFNTADFDKTTICGAIEWLIATAKVNNPDVKVVFVSCPMMDSWAYYNAYKSFAENQMQTIVDKWDIDYVDCLHYTYPWASNETYWAAKTSAPTSRTYHLFYNNFHPNNVGHSLLMASPVAAKLIEIFTSDSAASSIKYVAEVNDEYYATLDAAMAAGGEITMLADYEIKESIVVTDEVILDLNGHKVTAPDDGQANWYGFIVDGGDMTLKDSEGTGELYAKCYGVETRRGSFTLDGAKITAIRNTKLGTAIVNYGGTVIIKSGTAEGSDHAVYTSGYFSDASTSIEGGTINGAVGMIDKVDDNSGEFTETVSSADGTQAAADGYEWVQDGVVYKLTAVPYVAQIGDNKYETLEAAMAAGGEITMLADYEIEESIVVTNEVILDLNGKKITAPDDGQGGNWYGFIIAETGDMTLKDSEGSGELYAKCYGVETKGGSFTLDGAKITATRNTKLGTAIVNYGGTVTIKSGSAEGADHAVYTSGYFSNAATSIEGGTITGAVGMIDKVDENSGEFTEAVSSTDGAQDAADGYEWIEENGQYVLTAVDYVAQVGSDKYETLEAAMAVGGEITMLADYEIKESIVVTNEVTLDLNGCKITAPDDGQGGNWYGFIITETGDMTLKDSEGSGELYAKCYGIETRSGSFTLDGAKITATRNTKLGTAIVNYGGTVTINSGSAEGADHAVYTSGYFSNAATSIEGGTITGAVGMIDKVDENSGEFTETVSSADGTQVAADGFEWVKDGNVYVLTAISVPVYTIAFDANGGAVSPTSAVTNDEGKLTSLPTPTRSGSYSFKGWYTEASGGSQITTDTIFAADTTIYAQWTYTGGSGGGGSYTPSYSITATETKNGSISLSPKSASSGTTVTITVDPDKGYVLETLTVLDKNGKVIDLTKKSDSKYTFKMPSSKVTVEATFMEDNTMLNYFVDVFATDYYYDAVLWAVENGITNGTSATTFSPSNPCTRAQMATFLWRAAGSLAPVGTSPFVDVPADAYYADAVQWAYEEGITAGTSATTFSPDAICTRAQMATFLWRIAGSQAVANTDNQFADVPANAYYATAVQWAYEQKITAGTSATTFSPNDPCTRAQMVTFLYRNFVK